MSREYRLSGFKTAAVQDTHHILGRSASMEVQMCVPNIVEEVWKTGK